MSKYVANYKLWESKVFEQVSEKPITAVVKIMGATDTWASDNVGNQKPISTFFGKTGGDVPNTTDKSVLFKPPGNKWSVSEEQSSDTTGMKHYIKVGDQVIDGANAGPQSIVTTVKDLISNTVEAGGNGIYALARYLDAANPSKGWGGAGKFVIVLNKPNTRSYKHYVRMGDQELAAGLRGFVMYPTIRADVIKPNAEGLKNDSVKSAVAMGGDAKDSFRFIGMPNLKGKKTDMTSVRGLYYDKLKNDPATWSELEAAWAPYAAKHGGKKYDTYNKAREAGVISDFSSMLIPTIVRTRAKNLIKSLDFIANDNGFSPEVFNDTKKTIIDWANDRQKSEYEKPISDAITTAFIQKHYGPAKGKGGLDKKSMELDYEPGSMENI